MTVRSSVSSLAAKGRELLQWGHLQYGQTALPPKYGDIALPEAHLALPDALLSYVSGLGAINERPRLSSLGFYGEPIERSPHDVVYTANIGPFPRSESFQNFRLRLKERVISEGGHSGNLEEWPEGRQIHLPLNVTTEEELRTPSPRGAAEITIGQNGNLEVHMNLLFANELSRDGYPRGTYAGSGELRRVLQIVEEAKKTTYTGSLL